MQFSFSFFFSRFFDEQTVPKPGTLKSLLEIGIIIINK